MENLQRIRPSQLSTLALALSALSSPQFAHAQGDPEMIKLISEHHVKNPNHQASPGNIPVFFVFSPLRGTPSAPFPNAFLRDYAELNTPEIRSELEIRGPLARALYNKDVRLIAIETDPRKNKMNSTAGNGYIFIEDAPNTFSSQSIKVSPFAWGWARGEFDRSTRLHEKVLGFFSNLDRPDLSSSDAIATLGTELREALTTKLNISESDHDHTADGMKSDVLFFEYLTNSISKLSMSSDFSDSWLTRAKTILLAHPDEDKKIISFQKSLQETLVNLSEVEKAGLPQWLKKELSELGSKDSMETLSYFAKDDLNLFLANAAWHFSFVNDQEPSAAEIALPEFTNEIISTLNPFVAQINAKILSIKEKMTVLDEQKNQVQKAEAQALEFNSSGVLTSTLTNSLTQALKEIKAAADQPKDRFDTAWNAYTEVSNSCEKNIASQQKSQPVQPAGQAYDNNTNPGPPISRVPPEMLVGGGVLFVIGWVLWTFLGIAGGTTSSYSRSGYSPHSPRPEDDVIEPGGGRSEDS